MKIGPFKTLGQYERGKIQRKKFADAINELETNSCPRNIDPIFWEAQKNAYHSILVEFDIAITS